MSAPRLESSASTSSRRGRSRFGEKVTETAASSSISSTKRSRFGNSINERSKDNDSSFAYSTHRSRKRRRSDHQRPDDEPPPSSVKRRRQILYPETVSDASLLSSSSSTSSSLNSRWSDNNSSRSESSNTSIIRSYSGIIPSKYSTSKKKTTTTTTTVVKNTAGMTTTKTTLVPFEGDCDFLPNRYEILNRIHHGTYGRVYRARLLNDESEEEVAIKVIRISEQTSNSGFPLSALREIHVLQRLKSTMNKDDSRSEHCVKLIEIVLLDGRVDQVGYVLEFCEQDLHALLQAYQTLKQSLNIGEVKCLMKQLFRGLGFLHQLNIIHRDLKTSNLLLDSKTGTLKICDFGMSRFCPMKMPCNDDESSNLIVMDKEEREKDIEEEIERVRLSLTPQCMTLWYRPIEMLLGQCDYHISVDIWSAACVFFELLTTGDHLFQGDSEASMLDCIIRMTGKPSKDAWPKFDELFRQSGLSAKSGSFVGRPKKKSLSDRNHGCSISNRGWFARAYSLAAARVKSGSSSSVGSTPISSASSSSLFALTCSINLSQRGTDLIESMFELNPDRRPSADECERHTWFEEAPKCTQRALLPTHPALNRRERSTALRSLTKQREQLSQLSSLFQLD